MTTMTTQTQRFTLDEAKAEAWVNRAVTQYETGETSGEDLPEIGKDWNPVEPDEEITVYSIVRAAVESGIISKPADIDLDFEYVEDGDGGYYHFVVYVGWRVKLASHSYEMRKLGERDTTGVKAALAILDEAVREANWALDGLDEYVAARTGQQS